jgi:hypothetical protein
MENQLLTTDYRFTINPQSICLTEVHEWLGDDLSKNRTKQDANLANNATKGILSPKNVKRLKKAVNWLVVSSQHKQAFSFKKQTHFKFKINFITLTIPPQELALIDETKFKRLLNTFLTYHRKYSTLNNYIWKLEYHKDGRLHVHLTTDTYINLLSINKSWNNILRREGLLELHYKKQGNYTPPSCEVRSVQKVKKLAAYLAKYLTKNNKENPMFRGRVWGCSSKISKVLNNVLYVCPSIIGKITKPLFDADVKNLEVHTKPNMFGRKYKVADIYMMSIADWIKVKGTYLYEVFKELVLYLRSPKDNNLQLHFELGYN